MSIAEMSMVCGEVPAELTEGEGELHEGDEVNEARTAAYTALWTCLALALETMAARTTASTNSTCGEVEVAEVAEHEGVEGFRGRAGSPRPLRPGCGAPPPGEASLAEACLAAEPGGKYSMGGGRMLSELIDDGCAKITVGGTGRGAAA